MSTPTRIFTDVDYEKDGKQIGWLYLPYSVTRSAYGNIAIPVAVIKNGAGPSVLLMAGNHGDEYEGQVGLCKLIRTLESKDVRGRVIAVPGINLPAALAGARVSPIDNVNFNRAFPGDPNGTPTYAIAHYVDSVLFPMVSLFLDLHSGGSSLDYIPFVSMRTSGDAALDARAMAALKAFGAPIGMVWAHTLDAGFAQTAALRRGLVSLGGEFGGGGSVSLDRSADRRARHPAISRPCRVHAAGIAAAGIAAGNPCRGSSQPRLLRAGPRRRPVRAVRRAGGDGRGRAAMWPGALRGQPWARTRGGSVPRGRAP